MKNQIIIGLLIVFGTGSCFGQQTNSSEEIQYPYTVSSDEQAYIKQPKTLEQINMELEAIDTKIQFVKSHPEELEIAIKESWFEQMENYRKILEQQKAAISK